jgi:hypothetical protein
VCGAGRGGDAWCDVVRCGGTWQNENRNTHTDRTRMGNTEQQVHNTRTKQCARKHMMHARMRPLSQTRRSTAHGTAAHVPTERDRRVQCALQHGLRRGHASSDCVKDVDARHHLRLVACQMSSAACPQSAVGGRGEKRWNTRRSVLQWRHRHEQASITMPARARNEFIY